MQRALSIFRGVLKSQLSPNGTRAQPSFTKLVKLCDGKFDLQPLMHKILYTENIRLLLCSEESRWFRTLVVGLWWLSNGTLLFGFIKASNVSARSFRSGVKGHVVFTKWENLLLINRHAYAGETFTCKSRQIYYTEFIYAQATFGYKWGMHVGCQSTTDLPDRFLSLRLL